MHHGITRTSNGLSIAVLSSRKGETEYNHVASVSVQAYSASSLSVSYCTTPAEARDLAAKLLAAADAAESPAPAVAADAEAA